MVIAQTNDEDDLKQARKERMEEEVEIKKQAERDREEDRIQDRETKRINATARTWYLEPVEERIALCHKEKGENFDCNETTAP